MTLLTTTAPLPNTIALLRVETEVDYASPDINDNYSTRYVSDEIRKLVEDKVIYAEDETEAQEVTNDVLSEVADIYEHFSCTLGIESEDSCFGVARGYSIDPNGVGEFAERHIGYTLSDLMTGVRFEGGFVNIDLEELVEAIFEEGLEGNSDWGTARLKANAHRYILREGSIFELLTEDMAY